MGAERKWEKDFRQVWKMDGSRKDWKGRREELILSTSFYSTTTIVGAGGRELQKLDRWKWSEMMKGVCCSCSRQGRAGDFWVILWCDGWGDIDCWMVDEMEGIESRWMESVIGVWAVDLRFFFYFFFFWSYSIWLVVEPVVWESEVEDWGKEW